MKTLTGSIMVGGLLLVCSPASIAHGQTNRIGNFSAPLGQPAYNRYAAPYGQMGQPAPNQYAAPYGQLGQPSSVEPLLPGYPSNFARPSFPQPIYGQPIYAQSYFGIPNYAQPATGPAQSYSSGYSTAIRNDYSPLPAPLGYITNYAQPSSSYVTKSGAVVNGRSNLIPR